VTVSASRLEIGLIYHVYARCQHDQSTHQIWNVQLYSFQRYDKGQKN